MSYSRFGFLISHPHAHVCLVIQTEATLFIALRITFTLHINNQLFHLMTILLFFLDSMCSMWVIALC